MKLKLILLSLGITSVLSSAYVHAAKLPLDSKIDSYVQQQLKKSGRNTTVFIVLKEQADLNTADRLLTREEKGRYVYNALRQTALETQKSLVDFLQAKKVAYQSFYITNMIAIENPTPELIKTLAARSDVARIMGNPLVKLNLPNMKPSTALRAHASGPEANLVRIGATKVWENAHVRGEGIVIAGQDTGVQWNHPALIHQYRGSVDGKVDHNYNWHDAIHRRLDVSIEKSTCGYDTKVPCDDVGHGTHTIGSIVGDDGKGNQIGVAPKAQWMACKNMDNGIGSPASYIECFEFFLAPYPLNGNPMKDGDPSKAPHIINNSWGCTAEEGCKGDEILPALQAMKKAGILVVASAGNDGPRCSTIADQPAWHTGLTLSVGAFNHRNDRIAYFSSRGPSALDGGIGPNISAPGVDIRSSIPNNRYASYSGTSMAGPHTVGAAALLWSANKNLIGDIEQTISVLENSAEPKTSSENCGELPGTHIPNNTYGFGLLNIDKAISQ